MPSEKPLIKIRASAEQIEAWKAQAEVGESFNAWAVRVLDAATGERSSPVPATVGRDPGGTDDPPEAAPAKTADDADASPPEPVANTTIEVGASPPTVEPPEAAPTQVEPEPLSGQARIEAMSDEEYAAWLDEYPSRAMADGYTIAQWRALTPMARTARQVDGIRPGEEPWSPGAA